MATYVSGIKFKPINKSRLRFTQNPDDGKYYVSITSVLEIIKEEASLQKWINNVGEEEAQRVLDRAMERGTYIHEKLESFFEGGPEPVVITDTGDIKEQQKVAKMILGTQSFINSYARRLVSPHVEKRFFIGNGFTGQYDLMAGLDSHENKTMFDFKTSSKAKLDVVKPRISVEDGDVFMEFDDFKLGNKYWLQIATYAYAHDCDSAMLIPITGARKSGLGEPVEFDRVQIKHGKNIFMYVFDSFKKLLGEDLPMTEEQYLKFKNEYQS